MTAIKMLLQSKKFWTTIIGGLLTAAAAALARYGLEVSDEAVQQIAGTVAILFAILLGSQGLADQGKEAKKIEAASKPDVAKVTQLSLLLLIVLAMSCGSMRGAAGHSAGAFIDCLKPNTRALAGELQGTVSDVIRYATDGEGRVDWSSVKSSVRGFKSDAPLCAFQAAVKGMLYVATHADAPMSAGITYSEDDLRAGYADINVTVFSTRLAPL